MNTIPSALNPLIPSEHRSLRFETGRLVSVLATNPEGLKKSDLIEALYPGFSKASLNRRISLETSVAKLIQRARKKFADNGIIIHFERTSGIWTLNLPHSSRTTAAS